MSNIKEQAEAKIFAKLLHAQKETAQVQDWNGFWWHDQNDEEFISLKDRQIEYRTKQERIYEYILNLIKDDLIRSGHRTNSGSSS